ncbi:MAG: hypothetical protein HON33_01655 [Flavobacteriaceae bacterium]|nr:hypothetical protein [Flavobacteriaceae bacterium]
MQNPFEGKTKREIKIAIGQISGDEPSKDDQEFNIALTFEGKNAWKFVERVLLDFKSKRTDKYHKIYRNQLSVILANLYETYSIQDYLFTYYSRNNNDYKESKRYNPNELSVRPMRFLADSLKKHGWVDISQWFYDEYDEENRWCSRMRPSKKLLQAFKEFKITPKCIYRKPIELIRLKDSKKKFEEYKDTPTTNLMRSKLFAYNSLLLQTRIKLKRNKNVNRYLELHQVNFKNIKYYRIFNDSSFELGGRFYSAWWVTLDKDIRRRITLNDEKTEELDYSSLGIHLLYSQENLNYYDLNDPNSDPYTLKGVDVNEREVNKKIITFALNMSSGDRKRKFVYTVRKKIRKANDERKVLGIKKLLKVPTCKEVHRRLKIFEEENDPIKHHLFTSVGTKLQFKDSCIAESVIERMVSMRIPVLVIHDSFIVQYRNKKLLHKFMNHVFREHKLKSIPLIK